MTRIVKSKPGQLARLKKQAYRVAVGAAILALGAGTSTAIVKAVSCSSASDCSNQISNLQSQNNTSQAAVDSLQLQATSYNDAIQQLQQQINTLQAQIDQNQAEQAQLGQQITEYQQQIAAQKVVLGDVIRTMYVDGGMSNIELLASSKNLSSYVNKQEYRSVVQNKVQTTLTKINALQAQLKLKKQRVDDLLKDLGSQQSQLQSAQSQQNQLLAYNQQQQAQYNSQIQSNNSAMASLRAQQIAFNQELSSGGGRVVPGNPDHGDYPSNLANASKDSLVDPWGMLNRECVSYTAWKVYETYGYMPYWGNISANAINWPADARSYNIPTGSTPRVHSVAIWNVGHYGHAMWVEAVNPDGSIYVSQYNYSLDGNYSEMLVSASMASQLTYIYFN